MLSHDRQADGCSPRQTPEDERFVLDTLTEWKSTFIPILVDSHLPDTSIEKLAEILGKGSILYRYDVDSRDGTTATAIAGPSEDMAYWAFDLLVSVASSSSSQDRSRSTQAGVDGKKREADVGGLVRPALMGRFEETLRRFVQDVKLRGRLPLERSVPNFWDGCASSGKIADFCRVRQDEVLYVLRQLVTLSTPVQGTRESDSESGFLASCRCRLTLLKVPG